MKNEPTQALALAAGLSIDADYFAGASVALLGKRGAGKTYLCRIIAEELYDAAVQTIIVDPMGVFWGLRSNADGTAGLPIPVFGGEHGDAPLESSAGHLMADLAVDEGLSMILDLSQFPSRTQERTFAREFFDRLYRRNRTLVHIIVDEADLFAPQKPRREDAPLLVTMENLVRRGRNKGIGVTLASQRPATVNKDVLTQVDALVAMRVTAPQDRDAIKEWVRGQGTDTSWEQIAPSLPSLVNGEAWWWVPEKHILTRTRGRQSRTFDSSPTKKRGQSARSPKTFADVDMTTIIQRMQATIERVESNDPRALQRRIRELEAEIDANQASAPPQPVQVETVSVLTAEDRDALRVATEALHASTAALVAVQHTIQEHSDSITRQQTVVEAISQRALITPEPHTTTPVAPPRPQVAPARTPRAAEVSGETEAVTPARQRILDALASLRSIGVDHAPKKQVALWAGVSPKSSGYANNLGALRTSGLIDYPTSGEVALTQEGDAHTTPGTDDLTLSSFHARVQGLVSPARWRILLPLIGSYPQPLTKSALADAAGVSPASSGYANNLGALRSLGLIDYPQAGAVAATDLLFPRGLQ